MAFLGRAGAEVPSCRVVQPAPNFFEKIFLKFLGENFCYIASILYFCVVVLSFGANTSVLSGVFACGGIVIHLMYLMSSERV